MQPPKVGDRYLKVENKRIFLFRVIEVKQTYVISVLYIHDAGVESTSTEFLTDKADWPTRVQAMQTQGFRFQPRPEEE